MIINKKFSKQVNHQHCRSKTQEEHLNFHTYKCYKYYPVLQLLRCLRSVRKPNGVRAPINKAFNFD